MKAQVSLEFMAFFGLLLLVTVLASSIALSTSAQIGEDTVGRDAKRLAEIAATEINIAYEVGDGYRHDFYFPPNLNDGSDYNITFVNQSQVVYASWRMRSYFIPVMTSAVTGNFHKGNNIIKNNNGVLEIG